MSKSGKKLIRAAREAVQIARAMRRDWVRHVGQDIPVNNEQMVLVRWREGVGSVASGRAGTFNWDDVDSYIVQEDEKFDV